MIAVIGAGAAGLLAAIHAAGAGGRVLLLERTRDGGRKILISGGGRCNVLPGTLDETRFVTASSPHTLRNILRSWPLAQQRAFFETDLALPLVLEPETDKLFPVANRARAVRDALVAHAQARGVEWLSQSDAIGLDPVDGRWRVQLGSQRDVIADRVILCTGGLSVPNTGSDGFGLRRLAELGHTVHATYPALTPLTSTPPAHADLAGVSLPVRLTASSTAATRTAVGGFLFTHRGYSGPSVLDVSDILVRARLAGDPTATLRVQWSPSLDAEAWERRLAPAARAVHTALRDEMPARLADRIADDAGIERSTSLAQLPRVERLRLIELLTRYPLSCTGDEGYHKAEVTGGGVALDEVNPRTLESRLHPGLFLAGELLDAFGPIGGYNFAWAWATGRLAGLGAARTET